MNLNSRDGKNRAPVSDASVLALIEKGNALEEEGKPGEAMKCYQAAAHADPRCARAHLNRGNLLLASDRVEEARMAYQLAISCDQDYAAAYFNLGNLNLRARENEQALRNYLIAIRIKPDFADAFVAMGNALDDLGRTDEAISSYQRALAINPNYAEVHYNLGEIAKNKGDLTEAADRYKRAINLGMSNPMASYMLAVWNGENVGSMPDASLASFFDDYASRFENYLVDTLGYSTPKLMREAVRRLTRDERTFQHALDLGCGTGLIGAHFKDIVTEIDGVDLSPKMLDQAKRKQIYRKLECGEIVTWLDHMVAESLTYDLVLSADVFIYVGNLEPAFKAIRKILTNNGLLAFSVEQLVQGSFELLPTGRYAHSTSYVKELASKHGFEIEITEQVNLRKEKNDMIIGMVFVLRSLH